MNGRGVHRLAPFHGHGPGRAADRHVHSDEVDYEYEPFPEGDVTVPEACWDQHPSRSEVGRFFDRIARWGDQQTLQLDGNAFAAIDVKKISKQLVMYETRKPYGVRLTLNATDLSVAAGGGGTDYFVTWTVLIGCGSAQRTYQFVQPMQTVPQPLGSDIVLDVSAEVVRVSGVAEFKATYLPQKGTPTLQAMCAPQVWIPDEEIGPRSAARSVVR